WPRNQVIWSSGRSANAGTRSSSNLSTIYLYLAQILMDELHGHRPLTDSRGHAFHRAMPYVTYREKTGNIGLEQEGIPVEHPPFGSLAVSYEIGTRQDEATFVA